MAWYKKIFVGTQVQSDYDVMQQHGKYFLPGPSISDQEAVSWLSGGSFKAFPWQVVVLGENSVSRLPWKKSTKF